MADAAFERCSFKQESPDFNRVPGIMRIPEGKGSGGSRFARRSPHSDAHQTDFAVPRSTVSRLSSGRIRPSSESEKLMQVRRVSLTQIRRRRVRNPSKPEPAHASSAPGLPAVRFVVHPSPRSCFRVKPFPRRPCLSRCFSEMFPPDFSAWQRFPGGMASRLRPEKYNVN